MAGLSWRPNVLRRYDRTEDSSGQAQRVSWQVWRRLQARGALGEAGGGGRDVYEVVRRLMRQPSSGRAPRVHLLPEGEGVRQTATRVPFLRLEKGRAKLRRGALLSRGEGGGPKGRRRGGA